MKKFLLTALVAVAALTAYSKDIRELIVTTNPPMSCQNCENKIKKGDLRCVKVVKKIETNLAEQRVVVTYDADKTNPEKIEKVFEKIGYEAIPITEDGKTVCPENTEESAQCGGTCCQSAKN